MARQVTCAGALFVTWCVIATAQPPQGGNVTPWSSVIRPTVVESDVRAQIEALGEALKSPYPPKPTYAAVGQLAALFYLIEQYDGEVRWKSEARGVRDALVQARATAYNWDAAQRQRLADLQADLQTLLLTDKWPRAALPNQPTNWSQVAARAVLMRRVELGYAERLKKWDGKRESLLADRAAIVRDAEVIATWARVIQDPSYEFSDDRYFSQFAKAFEQQTRAVADAAAKGDETGLKLEIGRMQKCCDDCHGGYR